jgi:flagellar motility protein MotE (MotC chaperone)
MEETTMSQGDVPVNVMDIISGEETATESAAETNTEDTNPSQEGDTTVETTEDNTPGEENVPFHEHPRWKEVMEKNQNFEKQNEELKDLVKKNEERYSSLEKALTAVTSKKDGNGLDPEYIKLMGDDEAAKDYYQYMQKLIADQVQNGIGSKRHRRV